MYEAETARASPTLSRNAKAAPTIRAVAANLTQRGCGPGSNLKRASISLFGLEGSRLARPFYANAIKMEPQNVEDVRSGFFTRRVD